MQALKRWLQRCWRDPGTRWPLQMLLLILLLMLLVWLFGLDAPVGYRYDLPQQGSQAV